MILPKWNKTEVRRVSYGACMVVLTASVLMGCAIVGGYERFALKISMGKPFVIYNNERSLGWGQNAFPLVRNYGGNLLSVFYYTEGDQMAGPYVTVDEEGRYLPGHGSGKGPTISTDGGRTWRTVRPSLFARAGVVISPIYASKMKYPSPEFFYSYIRDDHEQFAFGPVIYPYTGKEGFNTVGSMIRGPIGEPFNEPVDVFFDVQGPDGRPLERGMYLGPSGVILPDGAIMVVGYATWTKKDDGGFDKRACLAMVSYDRGRTFTTRSIIATKEHARWGNEGPNEPDIEIMPNGDLVCVMRTGIASGLSTDGKSRAAPMLMARSSDGGKTWRHSKMSIPGVMPKIMRLRNDVVVLAFGRPGNNIAFSLDNGYSWGNELAVSRTDALSSGYIDVVELDDGRLLAVYDVFNTPLQPIWLWEPVRINGILGRFIEVSRR